MNRQRVILEIESDLGNAFLSMKVHDTLNRYMKAVKVRCVKTFTEEVPAPKESKEPPDGSILIASNHNEIANLKNWVLILEDSVVVLKEKVEKLEHYLWRS